MGTADFASMVELDSDDGLLELDGKKAVRDIVQFVSLKSYLRADGTITNQGRCFLNNKKKSKLINYFLKLKIKVISHAMFFMRFQIKWRVILNITI